MADQHVIIYTDGACEPNPGPGGIGVVLLLDGGEERLSQGYLHTTNNRMELSAAIMGLEMVPETAHVTLYSDSKYAGVVLRLKAELLRLRKKYNETDEKYPHIEKVIGEHWGR